MCRDQRYRTLVNAQADLIQTSSISGVMLIKRSSTTLDESYDTKVQPLSRTFICYTGFLPTDEKVVLGSWERGAQYFESILEVNLIVWYSIAWIN